MPTTPSFLVLKINAQGQAENAKGLPGAQTLEQFEQAIQDDAAAADADAHTAAAISKAELASLPGGRGC